MIGGKEVNLKNKLQEKHEIEPIIETYTIYKNIMEEIGKWLRKT